MAAYDTPQKAADFLKDISLSITHTERGDFSPEHLKYYCTLIYRDSEFHTTYQSNPKVHGKPTITAVMEALVSDAMLADNYSLDEFAEDLGNGHEKISEVVFAYEQCKKALEWLRRDKYDTENPGLGLLWDDMAALSEVLGEDEKEVDALVEAAKKEAAEAFAYEYPDAPEGFRTIDEICGELDLGEHGDEVCEYGDDIDDAITACADNAIDIYYGNLLEWLPENSYWIQEADDMGLLEGCKGDIYKMIQAAQYECFSRDMYEHIEDINQYGALQGLSAAGVWALSEEVIDELLDEVSDGASSFSEGIDAMKDRLASLIEENFEESHGDISEEMAERVTDMDYDALNPVALSKEAVRAVNKYGYEGAFMSDWDTFMGEKEQGLDACAKEAKETAQSRSAEAKDNREEKADGER